MTISASRALLKSQPSGWEYVGFVTDGFDSQTGDRDINISSAGVQDGDLIVVGLASDNLLDDGGTTTFQYNGLGGYTSLTNIVNKLGLQRPGYYLGYAIANSTSTIRITPGYDGTTYVSIVISIFRAPSTPQFRASNFTNSQSGAITPPDEVVGSQADDLIICAGYGEDDPIDTMTAGSDYTLTAFKTQGSAFNCSTTAMEYAFSTTSNFIPSNRAFTAFYDDGGTFAFNDEWAAVSAAFYY